MKLNKPNKVAGLPWRDVDGRVVVISPKTGEVHELNGSATFLWAAADGKTSLEEISQALSLEFEVSPDDALSDVTSFFSDLHTKQLIRWQEN